MKALTLVEVPAKGAVRTEPLPLSPRRDLRRLRGRFEDLMKGPHGQADDYLFLDLLDEGPVLDAMARLRQIYPNILGIQPAAAMSGGAAEVLEVSTRELDPETLFRTFFHDVQGRAMDPEETLIFSEIAGRTLGAEDRA